MLTKAQVRGLQATPEEKIFHLQVFDPAATTIQTEIVSQIADILPDAQIFKTGSTVLEIDGQNDIDVVVVDSNHRDAYQTLINRFSIPVRDDADMTNWKFNYKNFQIDITLMKEVPVAWLMVLKRLGTDMSLRDAYLDLKRNASGVPFGQYLERKYEFYNRIVESA